jgi:hypothetical protein
MVHGFFVSRAAKMLKNFTTFASAPRGRLTGHFEECAPNEGAGLVVFFKQGWPEEVHSAYGMRALYETMTWSSAIYVLSLGTTAS